LLTALLTILLFCVMIIPHEFGHFIVAKLVGVQVNEFSMGMGPAIFQRQRGETLYSVRLLPLGGYCAMEAEDEESDNPRAFTNKSAWEKFLVLIAGAAMNVITALLVMIIAVTAYGMPSNTLGTVTSGQPAAKAGIAVGDTIVAINDTKTSTWSEVVSAINSAEQGKTLQVTFKRDGKEKTVSVTPSYSKKDKRYEIGIACGRSHNLFRGIKYGAISTWNLNKLMIKSIGMLFNGKAGMDDITGPVGMVSMVNQTSSYGGIYYMYLVALICLNLAYINLLPIPALDGGRILFLIIRKLTRGRVSENAEEYFHLVGMTLLLVLFVFVTWNDITRLFR
jgi:regulator of sigma E protease